MLVELLVENYAVVERARVRFETGLNVLTGETGSGKSIVVDALGLLFGARASAEMIRSGSNRARISGIFQVQADGALQHMLDQAGLALEDGELIVEREILANGKSRAFAGARAVTAAFLRELAPFLGDIHGQHDQEQLFSADAQLAMLDQFAGNGEQLARVGELFNIWKRCSRELDELAQSEQERLRMADLWTFQKREIESVQPHAGEDAELENERRVLRNVAKLQENAGAAYAALYESPVSVNAQLRTALKRLEEIARIDSAMASVVETLRTADVAVQDGAASVRDYLDRLEADPARLEEVEARLASIERLKRKYGSSIEEILAFFENVRLQLDGSENAGGRKAALERELERYANEYKTAAAELTRTRTEAARELSKQIETELRDLAMGGTVFRIDLAPAAWSEHGADRIEFFISPNVGEEPRPLDKIASGGELSRIALALKSTAQARHATQAGRTLVFDEVDAGIGGAVAESVGRRLKGLARNNQVLCVTHLAQIAAFAERQYSVEKREIDGRTVAHIEELTAENRTREIGRMLSGQRVTPEALKHAEQLLRLGRGKAGIRTA